VSLWIRSQPYLLAFAQIENGKKLAWCSIPNTDEQLMNTSVENDANAYIDEMMLDKRR